MAPVRLAALLACLSTFVEYISVAEAVATTVGSGNKRSGEGATEWPTRSLTSSELVEILTEEWENDHAVMLMASWCQYCRQFKPIWNMVMHAFCCGVTLCNGQI
jgi:hypothetical protein